MRRVDACSAALDEAVVVALGSNLGIFESSPPDKIEAALARLGAFGLTVSKRSSLWRSAAWPDPAQPAYINAVALVETTLDPAAVLAVLHAVEAEYGRVRSERNAPRSLDLDLIAFGRVVQTDPPPVLPHPRAAERRFVMGPLAEIAPAWRHPVLGASAAELAARAQVGVDAQMIGLPPVTAIVAPEM